MAKSRVVKRKLEYLQSEYDLSELAANDLLQLDSLAEALASSDEYNKMLEDELSIEPRNIRNISDIQKLITEVNRNISSISNDLKIDRKSRERKTDSIPDYVKDLQDRARAFVEDRMFYIYCPKCKTLVMSMWILDYTLGHKFKLICKNCKNDFVVNGTDLQFHKNIPDAIVPRSKK